MSQVLDFLLVLFGYMDPPAGMRQELLNGKIMTITLKNLPYFGLFRKAQKIAFIPAVV